MTPREHLKQLLQNTGKMRAVLVILALVMVFTAGMAAQGFFQNGAPGGLQYLIGSNLFDRPGFGGDPAEHEPGPGHGDAPADTDGQAREDGTVTSVSATANRMIILRGQVSVEVESVHESFDWVVETVEALGGYVSHSSIGDVPGPMPRPRGQIDTTDRPQQARLTVRVPAAALQSFMRDVCDQGRRCEPSTSSEDIFDRYRDAEARLANFRAQETRLNEILASADSVSDLLTVEREIWRVREEIERLESQLLRWDDQVELSTVDITLRPRTGVAPEHGEFGLRLREAVRQSISLFIGGIETMIMGVGVLLPWALLVAAGWFGYRRLMPRRSLPDGAGGSDGVG